MLNVLYNDINWSKIAYVGFDMDGTLYDEYDFIIQIYSKINKELIQNEEILSFMLNRWLEKGSSYQYIFEEAYEMCKNVSISKEYFIQRALNIFRNFNPKLNLTERNKMLLSYFKTNYEIFLITDGNYNLQKRKFNSLGLSNYFKEDNVIFTGKYSSDYFKPNIKSLELLKFEVYDGVYFGDRSVDKVFASDAHLKFQQVYNMIGAKA